MKRYFFLLILSLFSLKAVAAVQLEPLLDKVMFELQAEQWVTTKTALVNVNVNATVTDQGIDKMQSDIMQKLTQISNAGEWHIVSFDRQQDQSGLESVVILAQARLPQTELANLRGKAKALTKPGETFTIDSVQFVPSEDEVRAAKNALRANIYNQAKTEIDMLNKTYPDQKFYLHEVNFIFSPMLPMANGALMQASVMQAKIAAPQPRVPLSVGNKQELHATVTIASMPTQITQALTQVR